MRWCQNHWDELRAEVTRQGLSSFVPNSGEQAMNVAVRQLEGESTIDTFDPLMGAMLAVNSFIGDAMGPGGHIAVIALDGCPVCKVDEIHMPTCQDGRHSKPCTTSIAWCFVNAVQDQALALQQLVPGDTGSSDLLRDLDKIRAERWSSGDTEEDKR